LRLNGDTKKHRTAVASAIAPTGKFFKLFYGVYGVKEFIKVWCTREL